MDRLCDCFISTGTGKTLHKLTPKYLKDLKPNIKVLNFGLFNEISSIICALFVSLSCYIMICWAGLGKGISAHTYRETCDRVY